MCRVETLSGVASVATVTVVVRGVVDVSGIGIVVNGALSASPRVRDGRQAG